MVVNSRQASARIALATHYHSSGAAFELETYLVPRAAHLLMVAHPLFVGQGDSFVRHYSRGRLVREQHASAPTGPTRYLRELVMTVRWIEGAGSAVDGFIGGDNLLSLAGLWLKRRRHAKWVVLYSIDYVPRRFRSRMLNSVYHRVDRFAARRVDAIWNVSAEIEAARRRRDGQAKTAPQLVVPIGTHFERIRRIPLNETEGHRLVFLGHLLEKQGLQIVLEALPTIRASVPDAKLLVIGDGPYRAELEAMTERLNLGAAVQFAGYTEDHEEVERIIAKSALAVAPYVPDPLSFTRYADPMKIKTYLACGVPVVLTDVPAIAQWIASEGAGKVVPYDPAALAAAVIDYLGDSQALDLARQAATRLGAMYVWDRIFDRAFEQTASRLAKRSST